MSETDNLRKIAETALKASPNGWWQKSWHTPVSPKPGAKELGELLCCFADEDTPRFWDWDVDGRFVATFDPPTVLRLLDYVATLESREMSRPTTKGEDDGNAG